MRIVDLLAPGWTTAVTLSEEADGPLGFCLDLAKAATARLMRPQALGIRKNNFIRAIILISHGTLLVLYLVQPASSLTVP